MAKVYQNINGKLTQVTPDTSLENTVDDISKRVDNLHITGQYTLPHATTTKLGGVIPDGTTITVDADGTVHATAQSTLVASDAEPMPRGDTAEVGTSLEYSRADHVHQEQDVPPYAGGAGSMEISADTRLTADDPKRLTVVPTTVDLTLYMPTPTGTDNDDGICYIITNDGEYDLTVCSAAGTALGDGKLPPHKTRYYMQIDEEGMTWASDEWAGEGVYDKGMKKWEGMTAGVPVLLSDKKVVYYDAVVVSSGKLVFSCVTSEESSYIIYIKEIERTQESIYNIKDVFTGTSYNTPCYVLYDGTAIFVCALNADRNISIHSYRPFTDDTITTFTVSRVASSLYRCFYDAPTNNILIFYTQGTSPYYLAAVLFSIEAKAEVLYKNNFYSEQAQFSGIIHSEFDGYYYASSFPASASSTTRPRLFVLEVSKTTITEIATLTPISNVLNDRMHIHALGARHILCFTLLSTVPNRITYIICKKTGSWTISSRSTLMVGTQTTSISPICLVDTSTGVLFLVKNYPSFQLIAYHIDISDLTGTVRKSEIIEMRENFSVSTLPYSSFQTIPVILPSSDFFSLSYITASTAKDSVKIAQFDLSATSLGTFSSISTSSSLPESSQVRFGNSRIFLDGDTLYNTYTYDTGKLTIVPISFAK